MKITNNIEMLTITASVMNKPTTIYPIVIKRNDGLILIDCGYPGQLDKFITAFKECNFDLSEITQIIITHQDIDHIGSLLNIKESIGNLPLVSASKTEIPYLTGEKTPVKIAVMEEKLSSLSEMLLTIYHNFKAFYNQNRIVVDMELKDGEFLPGTDIQVIHTPGHTPGHICLYDRSSQTLIAGDMFKIENNKLIKTQDDINWNSNEYASSIKKLSAYDIDTIICYHGGILKGDITKEIKGL